MRIAFALALFASLALAGCGDDPAPGARIRILVSAADAPLTGTLTLESLDDDDRTIYEARPLAGDADVYIASAAPPGRYRVATDTGWGMLWAGIKGGSAPRLHDHQYPATLVRLGKPRSLYVGAADPSLPSAPVTNEWAADWRPAEARQGEPFRTTPILVEDQGEGMMALRFSEQVWSPGNTIRILGIMSDGSVSKLLSYTIGATPTFARPRVAPIDVAPQAPLDVRLVPAGAGASVPDGVPVQVRLTGVPLEAAYNEKTFQGSARFDTLAALGGGLRIDVGEADARGSFLMDDETWRIRQSLTVVALPAEGRVQHPLGLPAARVREVRASYWTSELSEAGLLPLRVAKGYVEAVTVPGWQDLLIGLTDDTWVHEAVLVGANADAPPKRVRSAPRRASRVRGTARGAGFGAYVVFTLSLDAIPDPQNPLKVWLPFRTVRGEGFRAAVSIHGEYKATLPPGRYDYALHRANGAAGRSGSMTFGPKAEVRIDLSMR